MRLCALRALTSWAILMEMENTNKLAHASPRARPQAQCHAGCKPLCAASDGIRPGVERAPRGVGRDGGGEGEEPRPPCCTHLILRTHGRRPQQHAAFLSFLAACGSIRSVAGCGAGAWRGSFRAIS